MDDLYTERAHPQRRKEDREDKRPAPENYWDLRNNNGNIYIIPAGDLDTVLTTTNRPRTPEPPSI